MDIRSLLLFEWTTLSENIQIGIKIGKQLIHFLFIFFAELVIFILYELIISDSLIRNNVLSDFGHHCIGLEKRLMLILFRLNSLDNECDKLVERHSIGLVLKRRYNLLIKRHFNLLLRKLLQLKKPLKVPNNQPTPPNPLPILIIHLFQNRILIQLLFG